MGVASNLEINRKIEEIICPTQVRIDFSQDVLLRVLIWDVFDHQCGLPDPIYLPKSATWKAEQTCCKSM